MVTRKELKEDFDKVSLSLSNNDFEVPSLWKCMWPGLIVFIGLAAWQLLVASRDMMWGYASIRNNGYFSLVFTSLVGFSLCLMIWSSLGKYFSFPKEIREKSLIFSLLRSKVKTYAFIWVGVNILIGISCLILPVGGSIVSSASQFVSLCLILLFFNFDISRFDMMALSSLISAWRKGQLSKNS